jgi:hypothetical protein
MDSNNWKDTYRCDVAIIGGGFGGIAAAQALLAQGLSVLMTDEYAWIGGQVTSQALNVPDEWHDPLGEHVGINRSYQEYRNRIRDHYKSRYPLSEFGRSQLYLNPGNALCSGVAADSHVAHQVISEMLEPAVRSGHLTILNPAVPISAHRDGERGVSVTCASPTDASKRFTVEADFFLDATETGDTYPLLDIGYYLGSDPKSLFGEPHAGKTASREVIQSFTYCFVVEFVPGGNFTVSKPEGYEAIRDRRRFWLNVPRAPRESPAAFFHETVLPNGDRRVGFFDYRRTFDARNFESAEGLYSRAVINVGPNDYFEEPFLERPTRVAVLERAKTLSRTYLYWLQTEAPRDDGGFGYPELRPCAEATGTPDGLAQAPYIREGRRLKASQMVVEQDIASLDRKSSRSRPFGNSIGLGGFEIDIHNRVGDDGETDVSLGQKTLPYQIPLGSLVSPELGNFAVANKGIGVSQLANGAYRLHPGEWNIGEAAGMLAAFCLKRGIAHPNLAGSDLLAYQTELADRGVAMYWYDDLWLDHPAFAAAQILAVKDAWPGNPAHLRFDPEASVARVRQEYEAVMRRLGGMGLNVAEFTEIHHVAHNTRKSDVVHRLYHLIERQGWPKELLG